MASEIASEIASAAARGGARVGSVWRDAACSVRGTRRWCEGDCAWWTVDGGVRGVSPLDRLTSEIDSASAREEDMPARCHGCTLHVGAHTELGRAPPRAGPAWLFVYISFSAGAAKSRHLKKDENRERDHNATLCGHFRRLSRPPRARPTVAEKASPSPSPAEAHAQSARDAPGAVGGSVGHRRRWPSKVRLVESLMLTARSGTARPRRAHCGSSCP
mmetsp:Transcript_31696/g.104894  ORF Transcript_31696/g.104894 Transcript_31696/m.104894 type:complete len:217 (-) Transcript_31696:56-706(-)